MANEVALRDSIPSDHEMMVFHTMAETAVSSKMYKGIGEKAAVMMIMLAARELGIPAMQALNGGLNIINGKVEISARMMNAMIRRAGHQVMVKELDNDHCLLVGRRADTGETQSSSFCMAEARLAGLVKQGGGWTKWPKDMCYARALSRLARQLFPDVVGIGYVEGEISVIEAPIEFNDHMPISEVIDAPTFCLDDYLQKFPEEDRGLALQYLDHVGLHFGWSQQETLDIFNKDTERLQEKFEVWKSKQLPSSC